MSVLRPALGCIATLAVFSALVFVGASLIRGPEQEADTLLAAAQLFQINNITRDVQFAPFRMEWVDDSLASLGMAPPPSPPALTCIEGAIVLDLLAKVDALMKKIIARAAGLVDVFNLQWSYAGSVFFMFTLQTTIGYGSLHSTPQVFRSNCKHSLPVCNRYICSVNSSG